jgi:hypothetical protein
LAAVQQISGLHEANTKHTLMHYLIMGLKLLRSMQTKIILTVYSSKTKQLLLMGTFYFQSLVMSLAEASNHQLQISYAINFKDTKFAKWNLQQ